MKKLFAILLFGTSLVVLSGCLGGSDSDESQSVGAVNIGAKSNQ